jgi:hypothetical protein
MPITSPLTAPLPPIARREQQPADCLAACAAQEMSLAEFDPAWFNGDTTGAIIQVAE